MIGDRHVTAVHVDLPDSLSPWTLQDRTARSLLDDGRLELAETPAMVAALFEAIGVGQWFRYVTGIIKVASANALLVTARHCSSCRRCLAQSPRISSSWWLAGNAAGTSDRIPCGPLGRRAQLSTALARVQ